MDVVIFIGSESDFEVVKDALETLKKFEVDFALEVTSAHRSPERTLKLVRRVRGRGRRRCSSPWPARRPISPASWPPIPSGRSSAFRSRAAGWAGWTRSCPPSRCPRASPWRRMGTGKTGAANAALLAVEILALKNPDLAERLLDDQEMQAAQVEADSEKLKAGL